MDRDVDLNLTGTYNVTRAVFPGMKERGWGRIVTMSSIAGWGGRFGQISYSTRKAGLIGFGQTLALEGATYGITSNVLAPNMVVGDLADLEPEELEQFNPQFERIRQATPMEELGRETDVAPLICFLSSEQARYITGQVIGVTGGDGRLFHRMMELETSVASREPSVNRANPYTSSGVFLQ